MPTIEKMIVLSTGHVQEATATALDLLAKEDGETALPEWLKGLTVLPNTYGWIIYTVGETMEERLSATGFPEDLAACLEFAQAHDCLWIKFDRDGCAEPDLPYYDNW